MLDTNSLASPPPLSEKDFLSFRALAREKFGLNLTDAKHELVATRLGKKLRELKIPTYRAYYDHVVADKTGESLIALIDALSTNHTLFLREMSHFDFLRTKVLPALHNRPRIDIWSAPCSTGEEPYSIAITVLEELGQSRCDLHIHAIDISTKALDNARKGVYAADRVTSSIPAPLVKKYFQEADSGKLEVRPHLRRMITFERVNLIEPLRDSRTYPLIFCRNLLIYFDRQVQELVVNQLARRLEPGGYLFIGHSESLMGVKHPLEYVQPAIYRLPTTVPASFHAKPSPPEKRP